MTTFNCNDITSHSILVIDDEHEMRNALTHALSRNGHLVDTASNGAEALSLFKKEKYSLVISDIKMPEMSGMKVLEKIKKISPETPFIMMTAYGTVNNAVEAMKEGAFDYIVKPFSIETLENTVNKISVKLRKTKNELPEEKCRGERTYNKKIITCDPEFKKTLKLAKSIAPSKATVLIQGESGTGKELLASFIHENSGPDKRPYITMNCAALPENLAESELFGHEKGAFTGAIHKKPGKFELAHGGTILLDEISEMTIPLQAKLLRVLQEREIDRLGSSMPVSIDTRVIAISNIDLQQAVSKKTFREDLFYRLNVIPLHIPPLRERKKDIPLLADYFLKKYRFENNKKTMSIADETIKLLLKYDWKGNVRELENTIERAVLIGENDVILPRHLFLSESENINNKIFIKAGLSVREMEMQLIFQTLKETDNNRTHAAKILGISIRTLRNKLSEYREKGEIIDDYNG